MATTLAARPDPVNMVPAGPFLHLSRKVRSGSGSAGAIGGCRRRAGAGLQAGEPGTLFRRPKNLRSSRKPSPGRLPPALFCSSPRSAKRREVGIPRPDRYSSLNTGLLNNSSPNCSSTNCSPTNCNSANYSFANNSFANHSSANQGSANPANQPDMLARLFFFQQMGPGEMEKA